MTLINHSAAEINIRNQAVVDISNHAIFDDHEAYPGAVAMRLSIKFCLCLLLSSHHHHVIKCLQHPSKGKRECLLVLGTFKLNLLLRLIGRLVGLLPGAVAD